MVVIVDQKRLGGGSHSTVGTITDIYTALRLLFSRVGQPHVGYSNAFSFNDPQGMCPECHGLGKKVGIVADDFLDLAKSLNEGAVKVPFFAPWELGSYKASGFFDNDKKLADYSPEELELLLHGKEKKFRVQFGDSAMNLTYTGIIETVERSYLRGDVKTLSERTQRAVEPYLRPRPCPLCHGARLSQAALGCKIDGRNIAELAAMEMGDLLPVVRAIGGAVAAPVVATLVERLQHVVDIGLGYLSLNRETDTLSGGECQRIKMASELHERGSIYVLDEPTTGLHMSDVANLLAIMNRLVDGGNTVVVIEHNLDVVRSADWIVDLGPEGGSKGGRVVFTGTPAELLSAPQSLTAEYLRPRAGDRVVA